MKTITSTLNNVLSRQDPNYYKQVLLYVNTWDSGDGKYILSETALDITDDVVECGSIKWKLDREEYGEWSLSNVSLTLKNNLNQWKELNSNGYFPSGSIRTGSKIIIKAGSVLPDATTEDLSLFVGFIDGDPVVSPESKIIQVTIYSHLSKFQKLNAENISTTVVDELLGSDSGTEFDTANTGAGLIISVKKGSTAGGAGAATELDPSDDYSVSQENDYSLPIKITLEEELVSGQSLWISYSHWFKDKTIELIVSKLCDEAGIAEADRIIQPAIFSNQVKNTFSQSDATDFDLGADSDTDHTSGDVLIDGNFLVTGESGTDARAYGSWSFFVGEGDIETEVKYHFISDTGVAGNTNGYAFSLAASGSTVTWKLYRYTSGSGTQLATGTYTRYNSIYHLARIARDASGNFYLWIFERRNTSGDIWHTFGLVATNTTHTTSAAFIDVSGVYELTGTDAQIATGTGNYYPTGYYLTPEIDGTASLTMWGTIISSQSKPAGTSTVISYRSKAAALDDWGEWKTPTAEGGIETTDRYLQLRWAANSDVTQYSSPTLAEWSIDYYTSQVTIPLVNLTGLNCLAALEALAQMCNYEIGFNSDDVFIFRPRISGLAEVATLDKDNIAEVPQITDGVERVYNRVIVEFGEYREVADATSEAETPPTSQDKYGIRDYSVSSGGLLPAEHVNVAYAIAPTIWDYTHLARRQVTLKTKFILNLELGDIVKVNFEEPTVLRLWRWGDGDVSYGDTSIRYYNQDTAEELLNLYNVLMRVEGIELDLENWQTTFDLVEVL